MNKLILGATLTLGLLLSPNTGSVAAPGDGLDPNASATGNSNQAAMHCNARAGSMISRWTGGMRMI
ncbi:MAG: hypothetical protein EON55_04690 [Alphaproteobacteria bacterium]|nr:MAG: hypothetical protein EON55_04690 [Alphaproteobacteria bacterium]